MVVHKLTGDPWKREGKNIQKGWEIEGKKSFFVGNGHSTVERTVKKRSSPTCFRKKKGGDSKLGVAELGRIKSTVWKGGELCQLL